MTQTEPETFFFKEHFKSDDTAKQYEAVTGGVTKSLTKHILASYLQSNCLQGKTVLDNACGTGVITKELLLRDEDIKIEAADISPAMVAHLKQSLSVTDKGEYVRASVMDGQVQYVSVTGLI